MQKDKNDAFISPDMRFCLVTDHFHIFNCRLNPIAPVVLSISKMYLNKIYLKKFLLLIGEVVENVYWPIRKQQSKNFKICNIASSTQPRVKIGFFFTFSRSCDLKGQNSNLLYCMQQPCKG